MKASGVLWAALRSSSLLDVVDVVWCGVVACVAITLFVRSFNLPLGRVPSPPARLFRLDQLIFDFLCFKFSIWHASFKASICSDFLA